MVPNANASHFRLKAAIRDLVAAAGGIERAADICTLGKSTIARWQDAEARDFPNVWHVRALEAECGRADVSRAMGEASGLAIGNRPASGADNACLMAAHADAAVKAAAMLTEGAMAFSDNAVTPAELVRMDDAVQQLEEAAARYRQQLARARAEGGLSLVVGGAK